jgi:hypothetical protein
MKKLFFTAIALVAFSLVTEANTFVSAGKKTFLSHKEIKQIKSFVYYSKCDFLMSQTFLYSKNQGFSDSESNRIAFAAYDKCLGCS